MTKYINKLINITKNARIVITIKKYQINIKLLAYCE